MYLVYKVSINKIFDINHIYEYTLMAYVNNYTIIISRSGD